MNSRLQLGIAAALAAATVSLATAQQQPQDPPQPHAQPQPAQPAPAPEEGRIPRDLANLTFVQEPTASASRAEGADGELGRQLVEAINADPSFKGSKITVQPEEGKVTLTGSVMTRAQVKRAGEIAAEKVGGVQNVVNAIQDADPLPRNPQAEGQLAQSAQPAPGESQAAEPAK